MRPPNIALTPEQSEWALRNIVFKKPVEYAPDIESSRLCTQRDCESKSFLYWMRELKLTPSYDRKKWEYAWMLSRLKSFDLLRHGVVGLGFGVGLEPLGALFVKYGCRVVLSDLEAASEKLRAFWINTNQHCDGNLAALNQDGIASAEDWEQRASFRFVDMNDIPKDLKSGELDFCWSTNSLDHLGSLRAGVVFVVNSMECLKDGGMSVHTTEFNLQSGDTYDIEHASFYRASDMMEMALRLRAQGHRVLPMDFHPGCGELDNVIAEPPYDGPVQLKIRNIWPVTSIGFCVIKNAGERKE